MLIAFIIITGFLNLLVAVWVLWQSINASHAGTQHQARAHYLCMQAIAINNMPNNYNKITAYSQWQQELQIYGEYCGEQNAVSSTSKHLHLV